MEERHIVAIDLGTSKFSIAVAKIEDNDTHIVYYKTAPSDGIRRSNVFNPLKVSNALKPLISDAEESLGITIRQVIVGIPKYKVKQESATREISRDESNVISEEEVHNLKNMAMDDYPLDDPEHEVMFGAVAQSFSTAEEFQVTEEDICGMYSSTLEGNFKVFIGNRSSLKNIDHVFNNLGITVARKYFTPDAVAKSVLLESEKENGVALIDFGGGVTSVCIYQGGIMRHYAAFPFGGKAVTSDIKRECGIVEKLAENIKLAFGACMPDKLEALSEKIIHIMSDSTEQQIQIPVKYLSEIITARTKEIFEAILFEIQKSGFADCLRSGVVLTGGGANTANCCNFLKELSGYTVRSGYPRHMFSASDCDGIYETDATTITGLILNGKIDRRLNCVETNPSHADKKGMAGIQETAEKEVEETAESQAEETTPEGVLFHVEETRDKNGKKPKPESRGLWKKIKTGIDNAINFTGTLYDDLDKGMKNEKA